MEIVHMAYFTFNYKLKVNINPNRWLFSYFLCDHFLVKIILLFVYADRHTNRKFFINNLHFTHSQITVMLFYSSKDSEYIENILYDHMRKVFLKYIFKQLFYYSFYGILNLCLSVYITKSLFRLLYLSLTMSAVS